MLHVAEAVLTPAQLVEQPSRGIRFWRERVPLFIRKPNGVLVPSIMGGATGVAMSNDLENKVLDHILSATTYTPVVTTFIALFTTDPGETFAGTEVTGGSYARVAYTNNITNWPAASGGSKSNGVVIDFGTATANWGTITHVALASLSAGGVALFYGALTASKTVNNGDGFKFLATKLVIALD